MSQNDDGRWIALIFGLLFFLCGSLFAYSGYGLYKRDTEIEKSGVRVNALVLKHELLRDTAPDGSSDYLITYKFTTKDGQIVEKLFGANKEYWEGVSVGNLIEVLYNPSKPKEGYPVGQGMTSLVSAFFISAFGLVMGIPGLALFSAGLARVLRKSPSKTT